MDATLTRRSLCKNSTRSSVASVCAKTAMKIEYIDKPEQLAQLCDRINSAPWIAVDTEFLREKTYYPIFCLLQIATPDWVVCVDPIALPDLSDVFAAINKPETIKVLHSCRQDLEIFYQLTGQPTYPVFDTQIAAPLLGLQENIGYAMLVSHFLAINLSKAHTRTNWSARPLSKEQIEYAANDVIYLCKIYQIMRQTLEDMGRLAWLDKDFEQLKDPNLHQVLPANAWLKIKGNNKLTKEQLAVIQALSAWREQAAQAENKPKNWLIKDDLLIELAKLQPTTVAELAKVYRIGERVTKRYGEVLCQLINAEKDQPPIPLADKIKTTKKTQGQEAVLDVLTAIVRMRAAENSINPSWLASRKNLEKLLFDDADNALLSGWRYNMVGQELQGLLSGKYKVSLDGMTGVVVSNT